MFKVPVKGLTAPLKFNFEFFKEDDHSFTHKQSTLQVYLSETELQPHIAYHLEANGKAKNVMYQNQPKHFHYNPQVLKKNTKRDQPKIFISKS